MMCLYISVLKKLFLLTIGWSFLVTCVSGHIDNTPPRFVSDTKGSEFVVRVKEGPSSLGKVIYHLFGEDADGDTLKFGVLGTIGEDLLRIENVAQNEANVYLRKELDREIQDSYTLVLTVTDGKLGKGHYITKTLLIIVEDINDNTPIFRPYRAHISLSESSRPGPVETVEAFDQDEGRFGQVLYKIVEIDGDSSSGTFSVDTVEGKGVISLIGELDYERKSIYQIRVLAIDRAMEGERHTATAAIVVQVEDAEDQGPVFTFVPSVTRIPEDLPLGAHVLRVTAVDGDRGVNNAVTYRVVRGGRGLFAINSSNGLVTVSGKLDRESAISDSTGDSAPGAFILQIEATEVTTAVFPQPSVITEVTIILTDVNDESPQFKSHHYTAEINENAHTDMPVTFTGPDSVPQVYDHDLGTNGTFTLLIETDHVTYRDMFYVTPALVVNDASFMIRVRDGHLLDYEKLKSVELKVIAKETLSSDARSNTASVAIRIKDVNDNFPQFERDLYRGSVAENAPKGTIVTTVKATDIDSGTMGTAGIRYTSITGEISKFLHLDPLTGIITVLTSSHGFDREMMSQHFLTIEARDLNGKGNRNTAQLVINITDVNDNAPQFWHEHYEARLYENANDFESVVRVMASDSDAVSTPNSEVRYSIIDNEWSGNFTIDPESGRVRVKWPLDFEKIKGPKSDSRNITLTIRASDMGIPPLKSECQLTIHIFDRNDHPPIFSQPFYQKSIPEDIRDGSMVLEVTATDGDHSPSNSRVYYRIASGASDKFTIDANTGVISVATGASLDPDRSTPKKTLYSMVVMALDSSFGAQQKHTTAVVNVTIIDVNNKPPSFIDPGTVTVSEDAPKQYFITRVLAIDLDDKPMLRYSIDYGASEARNEFGTVIQPIDLYKDSFTIDPMDGTLRVAKQLDRELWDQIKLTLIVEDIAAANKGQFAKSFITIKITDVNDNRPQFKSKVYRGVITENAIPGTPIITVTADDLDTNKSVMYSLEGHNEILNLIKIDQNTGEISVNQRIDRERYSWINVTVKASDFGNPPLSGLSKLNIQVLDENDNNPVFAADMRQEYVISEDAPIGSFVGKVIANDDDAGVYGKVTYLLDASSSYGKFKIDRDYGTIIVSSKLDREEMAQYQLMVQAWDNYEFGFTTGESRKAFKTVTVRVLDVNDETPIITNIETETVGCAQITEFHTIGDIITTVTAIDGDDPNTSNGRVTLDIVEGNSDRLFELISSPPNAAKIIPRFSLRNRVGNHTLTIRGSDGGTPIRFSTGKVTICVNDVNDHNPVFIKPPSNITIRVPENATIGSAVVEVLAIDDDSGKNAIVRYKLRQLPNGHWKWFTINDISGLITVSKQLDREKQRIHEIRVEAYDLGEPTSLSTDLDLTILVTNVDDFTPEFTQDQFQVVFTENSVPGYEKYKLLPTIDRDDYDLLEKDLTAAFKAIPCYFIVGGDGENKFKLDTFTHELYTTEPLDREDRDNYTLIVQASNDCFKLPSSIDKFDARDNSLLQVVIGVKDVNDNAPKMLKNVFTGGFTTDVDFGTVIMSVKATDADIGANSVVHYYLIGDVKRSLSEGLEPSIVKEPFLINGISGEISVNFDPQRDMKGYFQFTVLANDSDGLSDTAKVYIYLLREDQRVRFVLRLTPQELREKLEQFRDVLSNITGATVNIDSYKFHDNRDGSVDNRKTDLYLHFVSRDDNTIMDVSNVLTLIDKNIDYLNELYKEFNVLVSEPANGYGTFPFEWEDTLKAGLVGTSAFLALMLVLVTCLCLNQKSRYERQLKAATAPVFGTENQLARSNVPNTNQHASEGSNPMWMHNGYENNWYKDDEQISTHSNGGNSLDENAVTQSPHNSLNGSANGHEGSGSPSSTSNERQALCRGIAVGRVTPQNITLPQCNTFTNHINHTKKMAPKPPVKPLPNQVTCNAKNTINNVYIESYPQHQHHQTFNHLSIMSLETTEL